MAVYVCKLQKSVFKIVVTYLKTVKKLLMNTLELCEENDAVPTAKLYAYYRPVADDEMQLCWICLKMEPHTPDEDRE